ncbi:MAG TPA: VOC family protein [Acidimicrobiales bacterium]|nr:VOC family protein [Acidimicrobiales bacterium]
MRRLNHAVLYVRDARRAAAFYADVFGFEVVDELPNGLAVFLRSPIGGNHHDLGLFSVGSGAPGPTQGHVGLYHLAWEVGSIEELVSARQTLMDAGAYRGESDHGVSKSLYGADPDANEFEVMWSVPADEWGEYATKAVTKRLDLEGEVAARRS